MKRDKLLTAELLQLLIDKKMLYLWALHKPWTYLTIAVKKVLAFASKGSSENR